MKTNRNRKKNIIIRQYIIFIRIFDTYSSTFPFQLTKKKTRIDARISKKVSQSAALNVIKTHKNFVGNNQANETGDIQKSTASTATTSTNSSGSSSSSIEKTTNQIPKVIIIFNYHLSLSFQFCQSPRSNAFLLSPKQTHRKLRPPPTTHLFHRCQKMRQNKPPTRPPMHGQNYDISIRSPAGHSYRNSPHTFRVTSNTNRKSRNSRHC